MVDGRGRPIDVCANRFASECSSFPMARDTSTETEVADRELGEAAQRRRGVEVVDMSRTLEEEPLSCSLAVDNMIEAEQVDRSNCRLWQVEVDRKNVRMPEDTHSLLVEDIGQIASCIRCEAEAVTTTKQVEVQSEY